MDRIKLIQNPSVTFVPVPFDGESECVYVTVESRRRVRPQRPYHARRTQERTQVHF